MVETAAEPVFAAELANEVETVEQEAAGEETEVELEVELEDTAEPEDVIGSEQVGVFVMELEIVEALLVEVAA